MQQLSSKNQTLKVFPGSGFEVIIKTTLMKLPERIFVIEDGPFEEAVENEKFKADNAGKTVILFIQGRNREMRGLVTTPQDEEEVNEMIEALKMYKIRFHKKI